MLRSSSLLSPFGPCCDSAGFKAEAVISGFDDVAMMGETVEHGSRHLPSTRIRSAEPTQFVAHARGTAVARREAVKARVTGPWTGLTASPSPDGAQLLLAASIGAGKSSIVLKKRRRT